MINWPGIIKFNNDPELIYMNNQAQWDNDADHHHSDYDELDCLIDVSGNVYSFTKKSNGKIVFKLTSGTKTLHEILDIVKSHAAHLNSCCVSKLYADSIKDAYYLVKLINESEE